jgi:hypothetical protein
MTSQTLPMLFPHLRWTAFQSLASGSTRIREVIEALDFVLPRSATSGHLIVKGFVCAAFTDLPVLDTVKWNLDIEYF